MPAGKGVSPHRKETGEVVGANSDVWTESLALSILCVSFCKKNVGYCNVHLIICSDKRIRPFRLFGRFFHEMKLRQQMSDQLLYRIEWNASQEKRPVFLS